MDIYSYIIAYEVNVYIYLYLIRLCNINVIFYEIIFQNKLDIYIFFIFF